MRTQKTQTRSARGSARSTGAVAGRAAAIPGGSAPVAGHTRLSGAWAASAIGLLALVAVLVFALQNLRSVRVSLFGMHGELPLVILLLMAAAAGAIIIFGFGVARITQLHVAAHRARPDVRDSRHTAVHS